MNNDGKLKRAMFAMACILTAEKSGRKLADAAENIDASTDAEMRTALRNLESLAEDVEGAFRLAREALADAAESYT